MNRKVQAAYQHCERLAKSHYENFPIGWFIPRLARKYVYAIYAFARTADDFSDEDSFHGERLEKLEEYENLLDQALSGKSDDPVMIAVAETIEKTGVPSRLLKDLLTAFRLDVTKKRYKNYGELESYCVHSANPIGRIVLLLFGYDESKVLKLSDKICTGIQLVNHWQDIAIDLSRDRVYIPEEDLKKFGYSYDDLGSRKINDAFRSLMRFQISRTRSLFFEGKPLLEAIASSDRRLRWQITLMWQGPMKILDKIEAADFDIFKRRPTISKGELLRMAVSLPLKKKL